MAFVCKLDVKKKTLQSSKELLELYGTGYKTIIVVAFMLFLLA